jgi:hypothetical protein
MVSSESGLRTTMYHFAGSGKMRSTDEHNSHQLRVGPILVIGIDPIGRTSEM